MLSSGYFLVKLFLKTKALLKGPHFIFLFFFIKRIKKPYLNKKFKDTKSGELLQIYRRLEIKIWVRKIRPEQAQRR